MSTPKTSGLDGRSRDDNGQIRGKNTNTLVSTLREIYGQDFAAGARPDMELGTVLERTGLPSLTKYVEAGMPPVPPPGS
jgi:hypothetical protein